MNAAQPWWQMWLPLLVVGVVFALRIKRMKRGRPPSPIRAVVLGLILLGVIGFVFASQPPSALGWALFAAGISLGGVLGIARAQLMRVERDPETGKVLIHQTPAGLLLLAAVMIARRLMGPAPIGQPGGHTVSLLTDALLGFAFGLMMATQLWLWLRVRKNV